VSDGEEDDDAASSTGGNIDIYRRSLLNATQDAPPTPRSVIRAIRNRGHCVPSNPSAAAVSLPKLPPARSTTRDPSSDGFVWSDGSQDHGRKRSHGDEGEDEVEEEDDLMQHIATRGARDLSSEGSSQLQLQHLRNGARSPSSSDLSGFVVDDDDDEAVNADLSSPRPLLSSPSPARPRYRRRLAKKRASGCDSP